MPCRPPGAMLACTAPRSTRRLGLVPSPRPLDLVQPLQAHIKCTIHHLIVSPTILCRQDALTSSSDHREKHLYRFRGDPRPVHARQMSRFVTRLFASIHDRSASRQKQRPLEIPPGQSAAILTSPAKEQRTALAKRQHRSIHPDLSRPRRASPNPLHTRAALARPARHRLYSLVSVTPLLRPLAGCPKPFRSSLNIPQLVVVSLYLAVCMVALLWKADHAPPMPGKPDGPDYRRTEATSSVSPSGVGTKSSRRFTRLLAESALSRPPFTLPTLVSGHHSGRCTVLMVQPPSGRGRVGFWRPRPNPSFSGLGSLGQLSCSSPSRLSRGSASDGSRSSRRAMLLVSRSLSLAQECTCRLPSLVVSWSRKPLMGARLTAQYRFRRRLWPVHGA
ncbi:hypothetical protein VNO80_33228 [Phaseolus coccineus]|uniref:Uncharacterized protein n=1 Tax=Phaseolus coccineus TaxID=3886 RepID=A0AAN9L398_PHACN